jgi:hypothetical protein
MKNDQRGIVHVLALIAVAALLGVVCWVAFNNFKHASKVTSDKDTPQVTAKPTPKKACAADETTAATNGIFCSEDIGIKFTVPTIFKGKLTKVDNYKVSQGTIDPSTSTSAGTSESVYSAQLSGNDNFTFSVAKEPLRSGYVDVFNMLSGTYFNKDSGTLNNINGPTSYYDSKTNTTTKTGTYSVGELVPSFTVGGTRFYKGSNGDAGTQIVTYFGVIKNKIIKIQLKNQGYIGDPAKDPTTIKADGVFTQLDEAVKKLQVL